MQSPPCPFVRRNLLAATSPPVVPAAANPQRPAGLCTCPLLPPDCRYYTFGVLTGGFWVGLALVWFVRHLLLQRYQYRLWRLLRSFVLLGIIAFLVSGGWWLSEQHMFNLEGSLGQWNESRAGQHTGRRAMHAAAPLQPLPAARPSCSLPPPAARRACCPAPLCPPCCARCAQVCIIVFVPGAVSAGVGIKNLFLIIFANFSAAAFGVQILLFVFRRSLTARRVVDQAYR